MLYFDFSNLLLMGKNNITNAVVDAVDHHEVGIEAVEAELQACGEHNNVTSVLETVKRRCAW